MGRWLGIVLSLCIALVTPRLARAGCGTVCEGTVAEAVLEPPIACLTLKTSLHECGCNVHVSLTNDCAEPLTFSGDELNCYQPAGEPCEVAVDSRTGALKIRTQRAGAQTWSVKVEQAGNEHTLTVDGEITSYDDEPGCAVVAPGARTGLSGVVAALLAVSWLRRVRRRR